MLGVSLSGAEQGGHNYGLTIGTDYSFPSTDRLAYLESKGVTLVGLPVMWEQAQPAVESALDTDWVTAVQDFYAAKASGTKIVLRFMTEGKKRVPSTIPAAYEFLGGANSPARLEDWGDFVYRITQAFDYATYPDLWFCFGAHVFVTSGVAPEWREASQRAGTVVKQFDDAGRVCIFEDTGYSDELSTRDYSLLLATGTSLEVDTNGHIGGRSTFKVGVRIYPTTGGSASGGGAVSGVDQLRDKLEDLRTAASSSANVSDDCLFVVEFGSETGTDDLTALDELTARMKTHGISGLYNAADNGSAFDIAPSGSYPSYTDAAQMAKIVANQF